MSQEQFNQMARKTQAHIAEVVSKALNIPVFVINQDGIEKVFDALKDLPELAGKYSKEELYGEVVEFLRAVTIMPAKNEEESKERAEQFLIDLQEEKNYEATILLPSVIGLPVGTKIGSLEIVEPSNDDEDLVNLMCKFC